ncbi:MAG: hypothetical protein V2A56_03205 [bacterium]
MNHACRLVLLTALVVISIPPASAQILSHTIFTDQNLDISGIVTVFHSPERTVFLTVHDSKFSWQKRVGVITIDNDTLVHSDELDWPAGFEKLTDIECIARCPGDTSFIMMTSRGRGLHFRINQDYTGIEGISEFDLPLPKEMDPQIEGFAIFNAFNTVYAFWGDRGKDRRPATVWWGTIDMDTYTITVEDSTLISVPWPDKGEVRHLSEMRIDSAGGLWITSVRDGGNHGPFDSAMYMAGFFHPSEGHQLRFTIEQSLIPILRIPAHKVEAFDFVPGHPGGIVFGTDDEKFGSILIKNW